MNIVLAVEAISCFQCTANDPGCDILTEDNTTSKYYLPCPADTLFCRKITQTILVYDKTIIARTCGWLTENPKINKCFKYNTAHKLESVCQCYVDGCNSAFSIVQKFSILFAMSLALILSFIR
ncbi:atilla isoform b-related-related [Holotrichia oblita]|uniref:Atilla isoform b-related-related n=1 Tax=Holotrichia oblita TaxID=644536 RepID=A0ACB9SQP4_HOLOL|nr:atilla isoform b-related-related [Holotrichia oblita]